jgi:hypothetical protein
MKIAVLDGQGGGIGKILVEKIKSNFKTELDIIALGTNALAVSTMIKAGAKEGASGENAIIQNSSKVDIIVGPIGIIVPNSMLGELTPKMAEAISNSPAKKVLIPLNKCNLYISTLKNETMPNLIDDAIRIINDLIKK